MHRSDSASLEELRSKFAVSGFNQAALEGRKPPEEVLLYERQ